MLCNYLKKQFPKCWGETVIYDRNFPDKLSYKLLYPSVVFFLNMAKFIFCPKRTLIEKKKKSRYFKSAIPTLIFIIFFP